jgi:hypothetical protein
MNSIKTYLFIIATVLCRVAYYSTQEYSILILNLMLIFVYAIDIYLAFKKGSE